MGRSDSLRDACGAACDCRFCGGDSPCMGRICGNTVACISGCGYHDYGAAYPRFNEKLASLSEAHDALQKKLEGTRLYASRQEIITRFESMPAAEFLREFKERMAEENERLEQLREEERLRRQLVQEEIKEKLESRINALQKSSLIERRLMRAYPGMHSKRFDEELKAWKRELMEKRSKKSRKDVSK